MKKAHALAMNEFFVEQEGKIKGEAEIVLTCFETKYDITNSGQTVKTTELTDYRFFSSVEGMREMAKSLKEFADGLEESQDKFNKE